MTQTIGILGLGGIGGTAFTPIINAPEVAILGVSRSRMSPVWNGKKFIARLILPLSLAYDRPRKARYAITDFSFSFFGTLTFFRLT